MNNSLYARTVFFVENAERSLRFYVDQLGFSEDWSFKEGDSVFICQVSLFGFEVILNEVESHTRTRAGHGRVFIGLDEDQIEPLHAHISAKGIQTDRWNWGRPTLVIRDLDANELFVWDQTAREMSELEAAKTAAAANSTPRT